jgi:hypothetical protein
MGVGKEKRVMPTTRENWKRGRGKLGLLAPLLGTWQATASSPMGNVACRRTFSPVLGAKYVELRAEWTIGKGAYEELALYGVDSEGVLGFWSFTSDGKNSQGRVADATDLDARAIGFEAQMPAGLARMVYWPHADEGIVWVVESKTKKGWNRFVEHHYRRQA